MWLQRIHLGVAALAVLFVASVSPARAELSPKVQKALKGKLIVDGAPIHVGPGSAESHVKAFRAQARQGSAKADDIEGVKTWTIHYLAFLKRQAPSSKLSFDFYTTKGKKALAASKLVTGWDRSLMVLSGTMTITEDDGLTAGKTYELRLTSPNKRGRDVVLAKTKFVAEKPAETKTARRK